MLDYNLDERGASTLYEYIYQRIRDDIVSGAIAAHEHLPSKRALADHLGVSVITVENAYSQLVAEGYVYAAPRRGFYASELPRAHVQKEGQTLFLQTKAHGEHAEREEYEARAFVDKPDAPEQVPILSPSAQEAAHLWERTLRQVMASEDEREVFSPAPAQGTERLRCAIARHLRGSRGMDVNPANIVVGAGAQLLDTMLVQLLGADRVYAVEDPGYLRLTRIYQAMGCTVAHIPLDAEGVRVDALRESGADVLHLMPSHQYPTGLITSIVRRYALLSWAAEQPGRYLIEDDFDCEFRLSGRPIPPLASIDATGSVIYTNTFSKSLSSALRLAYMVLPDELVARFNRELGFYSSSVSSIDQIALARLLESGAYERHVSRIRKRAREARDRVETALRAEYPDGSVALENASTGLYFIIAVRGECASELLLESLQVAGLQASPLSAHAWCAPHAHAEDGLSRIMVQYEGIDALSDAALRRALAAMLQK